MNHPLTYNGSYWGEYDPATFAQGIYGIGNVGKIVGSPIHTDGYGILIVLDAYGSKQCLIADCQGGGGVGGFMRH